MDVSGEACGLGAGRSFSISSSWMDNGSMLLADVLNPDYYLTKLLALLYRNAY